MSIPALQKSGGLRYKGAGTPGYPPHPAARGLSYAWYMLTNGPLAGLRVVELTDDTGRFGGKILAESGASVVRVGAAFSGPSMLATAAARGGLLDWWYDCGKQMVGIDLSTGGGQNEYRRLAEMADSSSRPSRRAAWPRTDWTTPTW